MKILHQIATAAVGLLSTLSAFSASGGDALGVKWKDVTSFSVNMTEDYIVFTQLDRGSMSERVYEMNSKGGSWGLPDAVSVINKSFEGGSIGGIFLSDDQRRLYFHAKKANSTTGFDIYCSDRIDGQWTAPELIRELSSEVDDTYPSVIPGEEGVYFLRHQVVSDAKLEKKTGDKMTIYYAPKLVNGKWGKCNPINRVVSFGYVQDARIARDGVSLYYSIRKERRDNAQLYFSRSLVGGTWLMPESMVPEDVSDNMFNPQVTDKHLFYIKAENSKSRAGSICMMDLYDGKYKSKPTVVETGTVTSKSNGKPIVADIVVKDPTTGSIIGRYKSRPDDGSFHIVNPDNRSYFFDVRADGFSYASYQVIYDGSGKPSIPSKVLLSDTICLTIAAFDAEIFRPVQGKVIAVRQSDKSVFRAKKVEQGLYEIRMPLGSNYNIIATGKNYDESKFLFRLEGDIVFDHYLRELPLNPQKRSVTVSVLDAITSQPVASEVVFENMMRKEKLLKPAPESKINLREGDKYALTVNPPKGYAFKNIDFDLASDMSSQITVKILPLAIGASLQLYNILFETGSAFLLPDAYEELGRVIKLLADNPELSVEISAHTDNVGNETYNQKLSELRAASVVDYLIENGANADCLISKGYGFTKPLVPNTSDENRQKNRRVEFSVIRRIK